MVARGKRSIVAGVFCAAAYAMQVNPAGAQDFSDRKVVIGAERITGLYFENLTVTQTSTVDDPGGGEQTLEVEIESSTTTFALLGSPMPFIDSNTSGGPAATPRLAVDVFVTKGLTVGGALTFTTASGTVDGSIDGPGDDPDIDEEDQPTVSTLVLAPRVGYAFSLSPQFAVWPRAGVTHTRAWLSQEDEQIDDMGEEVTVEVSSTLAFTSLTLEGMVVATPLPNVAILFGPFLDLGLGGGSETESEPDLDPDDVETETDVNYTAFGISAGIAIVF